jgi:uncharacterized protein YjbI with pentapeptide repeats
MKSLWRTARLLFRRPPESLWEAVAKGADLARFGLEQREARTLVPGLRSPRIEVRGCVEVGGRRFETTRGRPAVSGTAWSALHFFEGDFEDLALEGVRVEDCVFEAVAWQGGRFESCLVERCTFERVGLAVAFIGRGGDAGTTYRKVEFRKVDFREAVVSGALFEDCSFEDCRFEGVRFQATRFRRCRFAGTMRNVRFECAGREGSGHGELEEVDFRAASFVSDVYFVGYDLDRVRLPESRDHLRLGDYRRRLACIVDAHRGRSDPFSKSVSAYFGGCLAWAGPRQEQGVFHRKELVAVWGTQDAARVAELLVAEP